MRFTTTDLGLAAALLTCGINIVRVDSTDRRRFTFEFEESDQIDKFKEQYFAGTLLLEAYSHTMNIKRVKGLIHQEKDRFSNQ